MNQNKLLCPVCETGTLTAGTFADDFKHNNSSIRVDGLEHYVCDHCEADPLFEDQIRRNHGRVADAKRHAEGLLVGEEIRCLRDQLGLSQQEAALLFGGGANAFSKYERGDVLQSVAMDRLLKATAYFPWLVDFLRVEAGVASNPKTRIDVTGYQAGIAVDMRNESYRSRSVQGRVIVVESEKWRKNAA